MADLPAGSPSPIGLPAVDSGNVDPGGDFPERPGTPQDWPNDGIGGLIGNVAPPAEQGTDVLPPFGTQGNVWPSDSGLQYGAPAGQQVGAGTDPRSGEYTAPDGIQAAVPGQADDAGAREPSADTVAGSVANAGAQQAELSADLLVQGKGYGDQPPIPPDAYSQDGGSVAPNVPWATATEGN